MKLETRNPKLVTLFFVLFLSGLSLAETPSVRLTLDGNAADSSGNARSVTANKVDFVAGKYGQAAKFDAADGFLSMPTAGMSVAAGTVALWVQQTKDTDNAYIFGHTSHRGGFADRIQIKTKPSPGGSVLCIGMGDSNIALGKVVKLTKDKWYHIALTWQEGKTAGAGDFTVYIDGSQAGSGRYSGLNKLGSVCHIGNDGTSDPKYAPRTVIDDVAIWPTALNASEVTDVFRNKI